MKKLLLIAALGAACVNTSEPPVDPTPPNIERSSSSVVPAAISNLPEVRYYVVADT